MDHEDITRALIAANAFVALFCAHYAGDQWIQTGAQACEKSLEGAASRAVAHWHCAKHVMTYTLTGLIFLLGLAAWLDLPLHAGWVAAGLGVNAVTHYIADLRSPLRWMAEKVGRGGYVKHVRVIRPTGEEDTGPGTAMFHLDQAWHFIWLVIAVALIAGP
jgi:hypothetical protein